MSLLDQLKAIVEPPPGETRILFPALNNKEGEHELRWSSSRVTWSVGGIQKRKWAFRDVKQPVVAASFAWFDTESSSTSSMSISAEPLSSPSKSRSLWTFGLFTLMRDMHFKSTQAKRSLTFTICIFLRDIGHIYTLDGTEFTVNLPFSVRGIWAMHPTGLIIQSLPPINDSVLFSLPSPPPPATFSLLSPYDELRPISILPLTEPAASEKCQTLQPDERIIYISPAYSTTKRPNPQLVATVSPSRGALVIYRYFEQVLHKDSPNTINGESKVNPIAEESLPPPTKTSASIRASGRLAEKRRVSQSRNELSVTMDRMVIDSNPSVDTIVEDGWGTTGTRLSVENDVVLEQLYYTSLDAKDLKEPDKLQLQLFDTVADHSAIAFIRRGAGDTSELHILDIQVTTQTTHLVRRPLSSCKSIASVCATRAHEELRDLLILENDGSLILLTPGGRIHVEVDSTKCSPSRPEGDIQCTGVLVASGDASNLDGLIIHSPRVPVAFTDPIDSFVTLIYSDNRVVRVSTNLSPQSHTVRSAFIALSHLCSTRLLFEIRGGFLSSWGASRHIGTDEDEFACFTEAVTAALGIDAVHTVHEYESDAWSQMSKHSIHTRLLNDSALRGLRFPNVSQRTRMGFAVHAEMPQTLHALHLLAEELKVNGSRRCELTILVPLLLRLGHCVGPDWVEYWLRNCPDLGNDWQFSGLFKLMSPMSPPDLAGYLHTSLGVLTSSQTYVGFDMAREAYKAFPSLEYGSIDPTPITTSLLLAYAALKDGPDLSQNSARLRAHKTVMKILERNITLSILDGLPLSVSSPLLEAIRTCQNNPPYDWPPEAYLLIGRNDLAKLSAGDMAEALAYGESYLNRTSNPTTHQHLQRRPNVHETIDVISEGARVLSSVRANLSGDSDPTKVNFSIVRFAQDQRLAEVEIILDSSRIPNVKIPERHDLNEHDLSKELGATVNYIVERTFALPFGRAIYTFGSVSRLTRDEYSVPPIEMQVKFVPHNVTYPPDMTKIQPEAKQWAEFHNGVAASLRLNPYASGVDSSWIAFNKPHDLTPEHAGYLLGLGLTGHLRTMWNWHGYRYLVPKHEPTSIAILLGLGASHLGSSNTEVTRLLTIHMRPLLPPDSAELGIPLGAQSAALMGLGLLYLGTGDRAMADVALQELSIAHMSGGPEISNEHREAYTITAGLSYGLMMCGLGNRPSGPTDEAHVAKLRAFVAGKESPSPSHPTSVSYTGNINLNVVTPAATIALALMFLRTNRADVASSFAIPSDPAGLKDIQPSLLMLRALGRSLIMWDEITPSVTWILQQAQLTPSELTRKQIQAGVKELYEFAFFNILSGACLAIGLKYAGSAAASANQVLIHFHDKLLENLRRQPPGQSFDVQLRRAFIREAMNMVDLALALVMSGTGDVACMQRLRSRHGLFGPHIRYGAHIANHMALGFLFLGGGRYTLGTSNAAIACLVVSLFPRFPLHSNDTRGLLQAFRHLWALSVEPRCLIARDADTNEITQIPIKIKMRGVAGQPGRTHQFVCPSLLPDFSCFLAIKVDSPRYWPFVINIADDARARLSVFRTQTIYVKRRTGYLSYTEDPPGYRSISVWNGTPVGDPSLIDFPAVGDKATLSLPRSFADMKHFTRASSNEGHILAFADRLCRFAGRTPQEVTTFAYAQQCLLEALAGDKTQILTSLLGLYQMRIFPPGDSPLAAWHARDIHLVNEFYTMHFRFHGGLIEASQRQALLRVNALHGSIVVLSSTSDVLRNSLELAPIIQSYALGKDIGSNIGTSRSEDWRKTFRHLAFFLQHERVPPSQSLQMLRHLAKSSNPGTSSKSSRIKTKSGNELKPSEGWEANKDGLALVVQKTALSLSGPRTIPWSLQSVADFLNMWFGASS